MPASRVDGRVNRLNSRCFSTTVLADLICPVCDAGCDRSKLHTLGVRMTPDQHRPASPDQLLDHLICPGQEGRRDREAEGLGGLEVERQLELVWSFNRQIAGLRALEDLVTWSSGAICPHSGALPTAKHPASHHAPLRSERIADDFGPPGGMVRRLQSPHAGDVFPG